MENLFFKVSGEFITNMARNWFFEEKKDLEKSKDLLEAFFTNSDVTEEEKSKLIIDVLEGRKKFVGINSFEILEDNGNVKSIDKELKRRKEEKLKNTLIQDIISRPFYYIDSMVEPEQWEILVHKTKDVNALTVEDLINHFGLSDNWENEYLCNGLYIVLRPDIFVDYLILHFPNGVSFGDCMSKQLEYVMTKFWNGLLSDWKDRGLYYSFMSNSEKEVYRRQLEACDICSLDFPYGDIVDEQKVQDLLNEQDNIMDKDIPAIEKDKECYYFNPNKELHQKSWEYYVIGNFDTNSIGIPEKIFKNKYALISPTGDYFSTTFGGHSTKALSIIATDKLLIEKYVDYLIEHGEIEKDHKMEALEDIRYYGFVISGVHTALDFLMENKWCKVSNSSGGEPIPVVYDEIRGMTKEQEKTFFNSRLFFEKDKKGTLVY